MSKQALDAFRARLGKDEALRSEMKRVLSASGTKSTASFDELVEFAKAQGYAFTADEAVPKSADLSDSELDRVVGGAIGDPATYGEWIADVEQPSSEFRGRYQLKLSEAQNLLAKSS